MSNPNTHFTSNFSNSPSPVCPNRPFGPNALGSGMSPQMNVTMNMQAQIGSSVASPMGSGSTTTPYNMTNVQQSQQTTPDVPQTTPAPTQTPDNPAQQAQPAPSKEFNTLTLCRLGQETVQDIVSRTQEVFQALKNIYPPNGTNQGLAHAKERKAKMQEQLRTIRILFKRLRLIYEKCQLQGMEYTHIESLLPIKDDMDGKVDERKTSEAYRAILDEHIDLSDLVALRNRQIKEVVDHLRRVIWEINTMLVMRRS